MNDKSIITTQQVKHIGFCKIQELEQRKVFNKKLYDDGKITKKEYFDKLKQIAKMIRLTNKSVEKLKSITPLLSKKGGTDALVSLKNLKNPPLEIQNIIGKMLMVYDRKEN